MEVYTEFEGEDCATDDCFNEYTSPVDKRSKSKIEEDVKAYDPQAEEDMKRKEMAEIYGDDWEKVLNAETSLHLNFNRFCDKELPQTWPCLPLNLKFD